MPLCDARSPKAQSNCGGEMGGEGGEGGEGRARKEAEFGLPVKGAWAGFNCFPALLLRYGGVR